VDEPHVVAGDTELLGKRWLVWTARAWFQPPAKGEVAPLVEELGLQRPAIVAIDLDGNRQTSSSRLICG
jgi:hypothetical protein